MFPFGRRGKFIAKNKPHPPSSPWVPLGSHGCSMGVPWGSPGFPWVPMGSHGSPWVPMGSPLAPLGSHGFPWVLMGSHGFPWIPMGSFFYDLPRMRSMTSVTAGATAQSASRVIGGGCSRLQVRACFRVQTRIALQGDVRQKRLLLYMPACCIYASFRNSYSITSRSSSVQSRSCSRKTLMRAAFASSSDVPSLRP